MGLAGRNDFKDIFVDRVDTHEKRLINVDQRIIPQISLDKLTLEQSNPIVQVIYNLWPTRVIVVKDTEYPKIA